MNTIIRTSFTERLAFLEPPDHATRRALKAAGFKFNGVLWQRTRGTTSTLTPGQLEYVISPGKAFSEEG